MQRKLSTLLLIISLFATSPLWGAANESGAVASVQDYNWLILMVAAFAVGVVVIVALCRRRRRRSKLHGLSHML